MLNFKAVRDGEITLSELITDLTLDDLRKFTNEMIEEILSMISDCVSADVVFQPSDPEAHDPFAEKPEDVDLAWTLGHVIVHITASAEEAAALAAELARGVALHGRSRYEVAWGEMKTIEMCRHRLEESRRIRLASLGMWPDEPHLEITHTVWKNGPKVNAIGRFVLGLSHDDSHIEQIADIVSQAKAARSN